LYKKTKNLIKKYVYTYIFDILHIIIDKIFNFFIQSILVR